MSGLDAGPNPSEKNMTLPLDGELPESRIAALGSAIVAPGDAPELIMLCGPAYSGKSTLAASLEFQTGYEVISLDAIHDRRGNKHPISEPEWASVHREALGRLEETLSQRRSAILDDTNCYHFLRNAYRSVANENHATTQLVVLRISATEVWARREMTSKAADRHILPANILAQHLENFEWPTESESPLFIAEGTPTEVAAQLVLGRSDANAMMCPSGSME